MHVHLYSLLYELRHSAFVHLFFFFNAPATTEIYTFSLHDALPICTQPGGRTRSSSSPSSRSPRATSGSMGCSKTDRKSTRLNSSHSQISYAVFCLKKKKTKHTCSRLHTPTQRTPRPLFSPSLLPTS